MPIIQRYLPTGPEWSFEVKFDGYRAQLHIDRGSVVIYSRNGNDMTSRFRTIAEAARKLPVKQAIIDGEIVADGAGQMPDFVALHRRAARDYALWAFDLLALNGRDMRQMPLQTRRKRLQALIAPGGHIRYSQAFADGDALLRACAEHKLEGVVAKRLADPYRSGKTGAWVKVKTRTWQAMNAERHKLFERG